MTEHYLLHYLSVITTVFDRNDGFFRIGGKNGHVTYFQSVA